MDGATWFNVESSFDVTPRWVVYPYCNSCELTHAFSALDNHLWTRSCKLYSDSKMPPPTTDRINKNKQKLNGKGSKHHGAANLSLLLYLQNKCKDDNFRIFTISADGPIKEWPAEFLREV
jgi:hypothetical protein